MALGPKLNFLNPGDALRSSKVMQNFQAIADFCRAIPVNNLLQPYQTTSYDMELSDTTGSAVAPGTTVYFGYTRVMLGQAPTYLSEGAIAWMRGPAGGLAAGDIVSFDLQRATPSGTGGRIVSADTWFSCLAAPIQFDSTNTVPGTDNPLGDDGTFVQTATPASGSPLSNGDWIRWSMNVLGPGAAYNVIEAGGQLNVKSYLRS